MALKWQGDAPVAAFVVVSVCTFMAISMTPPLLYVIMITCNAALSVAFWFLVRRALSAVRDLPVDAKAVFVTGRLSIPGMAVPSAASAALCQYADGLRREMVKFGVQVCTVEPAFYRTGTTDRDAVSTALDSLTKRMDPSVREAYGESYLETFRSSFPKRLWRFSRGDLDEVSDAVLGALLSPEANVRYRCCSWRQVFTWAVLELLPRRIGDYFMLVQFTPRYRVMAAAPRSPPDLTSVEQSHVDVLRDLYGSPPRSPFGSGSPPAQVDASQTTRP
ncbi:17-beta-hydroxysteroid dehydrogenase type 6-like [Ixodes scapularis]|uniref:17-beta-hydroxysteroid dehydrogenase type 6-like n=1 Tax=Ixodes scapularis TaxID=6945 RepID=UPI001A9DF07A|nr:17-beta-hydroxysteroid dehydrogenase type 6-like [Ixodes scapularis]